MAEEQQNENGEKPALTQEEHDAAMAEKFRQQRDAANGAAVKPEDNPPSRKAERPAHVPEKFWDAEKGEVNVEAMSKSYAELEKRASQKPKDDDGTKPGTKDGEGEKPKEGEKPNDGEDAYVAGVKGFTSLREQATQKLLAGEELTEEMYAGFEKHGLTREDIGDWIAGQEARGKLARMEVFALPEIGGEDHYKAMIEWARANFDEKEVEVYDRDIHSYDKAVRFAAARGLAARYKQANGKSGRSVTNGTAGKRGMEGYASGAEMRRAMRDPKYKTDPAYREEVARKVAAARAAGVDLMV